MAAAPGAGWPKKELERKPGKKSVAEDFCASGAGARDEEEKLWKAEERPDAEAEGEEKLWKEVGEPEADDEAAGATEGDEKLWKADERPVREAEAAATGDDGEEKL